MLIDRFRADGKIAVVTGGGRGIGLAITHALLEAGARVVVCSRTRSPELDDFQANGLEPEFLSADFVRPNAPQQVIDAVVARHGRIDILVNNSGVADSAVTEQFDDERLFQLMEVNFTSVFRACRAAVAHMKPAGGGVILNIGSISGIISNIPQPQAAYNASKAAVHMLTKSLASDHALDNIRVNCIAPGYIRTELTAKGLDDPVTGAIWKDMTPVHRAGTAEEIATAALFFCTEASSYCTGSVLVIDGGYILR